MRFSHRNEGANLAAVPIMDLLLTCYGLATDLLLLFTVLAHTTPRNTTTVLATPTVPLITKYACTQL